MDLRRASVAAIVAVVLVGAASARGKLPPQCRASQVRGTFAEVAGSAGAGNIVYVLSLRNHSRATCFVTGLPVVTLIGGSGRPLPTHVVSAHPGAGTAVLVTLRPGGRAKATARFSPDVPGTGEPSCARCEPVAYRLRLRLPDGGAVVAPIVPPTSVCEHGSLQFSFYQHA